MGVWKSWVQSVRNTCVWTKSITYDIINVCYLIKVQVGRVDNLSLVNVRLWCCQRPPVWAPLAWPPVRSSPVWLQWPKWVGQPSWPVLLRLTRCPLTGIIYSLWLHRHWDGYIVDLLVLPFVSTHHYHLQQRLHCHNHHVSAASSSSLPFNSIIIFIITFRSIFNLSNCHLDHL